MQNIDGMELDFNDLIYRTNVFIMQNDSNMLYESTYSLIDYLERILTPYHDDAYIKRIDEISKRDIPTSKTAAQERVNIDRFKHDYMMDKHAALMRLAFRCGFLPTPKKRNDTDIDNSI